jgi:hypothetical protein
MSQPLFVCLNWSKMHQQSSNLCACIILVHEHKKCVSRSLNVVRVSLRSKRVLIMSTNSQSVSLRSIPADMKHQHGHWCGASSLPRVHLTGWLPLDEPLLEEATEVEQEPGRNSFMKKLPARHDLHGHWRGAGSDGAGEAATRAGEVEARRELLGLRYEVWAWVWVVGRSMARAPWPSARGLGAGLGCWKAVSRRANSGTTRAPWPAAMQPRRPAPRRRNTGAALWRWVPHKHAMSCGLWVWTCLDLSDTRTTFRDRDDTLFEFVYRVDTGAQVWGPLVNFTPLIDIAWAVFYLIFGKLVDHFFVCLLVFRVFLFVSF